MDDLVIISDDTYKNHMDILYDVLKQLGRSGMHVNIVKCEYSQNLGSRIGSVVMQERIKPQPPKVNVIMGIETPEKKCHIRSFIGMVNLYSYFYGRNDLIC